MIDDGISLLGNRFNECPPTAGPPNMRRCVVCFAYRLTARPFAGELCLEYIHRRLVAAKWLDICAKMWGRRNAGFWEYGVAWKYLARCGQSDSQED